MSTTHTPPASTLSSPSDTELTANAMPPPPPRPVYLIVATALKPAMGIGVKGELPWPALKKDMAFFRRVTASVPRSGGGGRRNAVLMGRKTWESIPASFRPLKGRVNVVITRDVAAFGAADGKEVLAVGGLREGMEVLGMDEDVASVFVIGGSQIYGEAVRLTDEGRGPLRILQTQVRRRDGGEIECDTFFPVELGETAEGDGWKQATAKEVEGWVDGQTVPGGDGQWDADGDGRLEIRVVGWEKVS